MQAPAHHREQGRNYDVENLIRGASAAAGRMLVALAWYYPELRSADERRWNFLATAAGLYLASRSTELTRTDQHDLPDHLAQAMASCRHFVSRATRGATDALTLDWAVGYWVLSGLFRQEPRVDQAWLAAAIGETLSRTSDTLANLTRLQPSASKARPAAAAASSSA
jgi:hypothetical protein